MTSSASSGTVLAVAPTGTHSKDEVPHLPVTAQEVATVAADCERVGAALIDLQPRSDCVVADLVAAIRARSSLLVRVAAHARSESLGSLLSAGADIVMCPLDAPAEFVADLRERASAQGIAVHYEAYTLTQVARLGDVNPGPTHVVIVFGGSEGMPGDLQTFAAATALLPADATFCAAGQGSAAMPVMLTSLAAGGHLRMGLADTLQYSDNVPARDNTQLVARAAGLAKITLRAPLSPAQATKVVLPPTTA